MIVPFFIIAFGWQTLLPCVSGQQQKTADYYYDDDYYYYEDGTPIPATAPQQQRQPAPEAAEETADYDLSDLVKAWKAYISEKGSRERNNRPRVRTTSAPVYECPPGEDSYRTPDATQCDKFFECNIKGEESEMLCPDGLVFDVKSEHCDYPSKVNCTGRPLLQEAQSSKNCPRATGFFPFPANESCQKFWDCREGKSYLQICPEGVIFDSFIDACTTPDQSKRIDCSAGKFLGFECPVYGPEAILRFGNHDRLPHPTNCQQFFSCLKTGQPRLGACPRKTVFSNATGHCAEPATVPGCENYWDEKQKEEDYYEYYE